MKLYDAVISAINDVGSNLFHGEAEKIAALVVDNYTHSIKAAKVPDTCDGCVLINICSDIVDLGDLNCRTARSKLRRGCL